MSLFNPRPGRGLTREDVDKKGVSLYLDILGRRLGSLITLNLTFILFSIPAIVIAFFMTAYMSTWVAQMLGLNLSGIVAEGLSLLSFFAALAVLLFCGSGPASAGMITVLRKHATDTHSWGWSDFIEGFKKNFLQSLAVYIINIFATNVFFVGFFRYSYMMTGLLSGVLAVVVAIAAIIFFIMQIYTYQLLVSVELKIKDIYKNAFILTMGKLPWNILVAVVTALIMVFVFEIFIALPEAGLIVAAIFAYSFIAFTQVFMTNNILDKYVLKPSQEEHSEEKKD